MEEYKKMQKEKNAKLIENMKNSKPASQPDYSHHKQRSNAKAEAENIQKWHQSYLK